MEDREVWVVPLHPAGAARLAARELMRAELELTSPERVRLDSVDVADLMSDGSRSRSSRRSLRIATAKAGS